MPCDILRTHRRIVAAPRAGDPPAARACSPSWSSPRCWCRRCRSRCILPDLYRASAVVLVERPVPETFVRPAVSGELESRLHVIKQEILSRARLTELINRFDLYPELREPTATWTRRSIACATTSRSS